MNMETQTDADADIDAIVTPTQLTAALLDACRRRLEIVERCLLARPDVLALRDLERVHRQLLVLIRRWAAESVTA